MRLHTTAVTLSMFLAIPLVAAQDTEIRLEDGDWKDVESIISSNKGRVIVVDFWSTACEPCMKEFPHLVELQKKHGQKVVCVSFNLDYVGIKSRPPAHYRPRVEKFLESRKANIRNLLSTTESDDIYQQLKLLSVPTVFVYGPDGKPAKRFDDAMRKQGEEMAFTYKKDIFPFVEQLLK